MTLLITTTAIRHGEKNILSSNQIPKSFRALDIKTLNYTHKLVRSQCRSRGASKMCSHHAIPLNKQVSAFYTSFSLGRVLWCTAPDAGWVHRQWKPPTAILFYLFVFVLIQDINQVRLETTKLCIQQVRSSYRVSWHSAIQIN